MLYIQIPKNNEIIEKIKNFYLMLYEQRLYSNAKVKITRGQVEDNIRKSLYFIGKHFDDSVLKNTIIPKWKELGMYEIRYKKWH